MKRRIMSILCAAVLTMSLVACGAEEKLESPAQASKQETAVSSNTPTPEPMKEWKAPEPKLLSLGGEGGGGDIPDEWLVDENTQLPETMIVSRNDGYGITLADLDKAKMAQTAQGYLRILYGDDALELGESQLVTERKDEYGAEQFHNQYYYEDEGTELYIRKDTILARVKQSQELYDAVAAGNTEALLALPAVQAAIRTAGLNEAEIVARYSNDCYLIWEKGKTAAEDAYNREFRSVKIRLSTEPKVSFYFYYQPLREKAELPVLPYSDALRFIEEGKWGKLTGDGVRCEIVYESPGDFGQLVPCYRFTLNHPKFFGSLYVPMVDYESVTEEDYETIEELQEESSSEPVSSEPEPVSSELSEPETVTSLPPEEN